MSKPHSKKTVVLLLLNAAVFISVTAYKPYQQPRKRNLKVLPQDISRDSLQQIMRGYNTALGVKCNFCHAQSEMDPNRPDFASDAKPEKETTREMIRMTNDINRRYFTPATDTTKVIQAVSCATCHRGHELPEE
ncbi:c-type cytochrome [Filimonas effusa]|uniref:Photosynthetic reaction center cytochrome c subunit n=1 Tax=Filimonas effusa TaxID=2508721 RepID=A0A4Q1DCV0_9BACT|nr:c-type cytochrome [Filimonas effusa]RXK86463.1 c-type cytochrome [Filimonas effusa]